MKICFVSKPSKGLQVLVSALTNMNHEVNIIKPSLIHKYNFKGTNILINWRSGESLESVDYSGIVINGVIRARNKLEQFNILGSLAVPNTEDSKLVDRWLRSGFIVFGRKLLRSHSGKGIALMKSPDDFTQCQVYTQYTKGREFRVHVICGNIISILEKKRFRKERRPEEFNSYIKSHSNGWCHCEQIEINDIQKKLLTQYSISTMRRLRLDIGAVDIILMKDQCAVLEVNRTPGLSKTRAIQYANQLSEITK